MRSRRLALALVSVVCLMAPAARAAGSHWDGHDFAFVFVTDDGKRSNLAWADTARVMDFRFTIAVNAKRGSNTGNKLTEADIRSLWTEGFEIGQHGRSHGEEGLTTACGQPPRGSWKGYFMCPEPDYAARMAAFKVDIERDSIAAVCNIPVSAIRTAAYPRHWHGKAMIDSLMAEGFIGARTGGYWDYSSNSNGEFTTPARNSWDGGISLYRIPLAPITETQLFGNHSATPPVHKTYAEFLAMAQPMMDAFRASGGILVMYTHHLGDDDDSLGNINYGSGGITKRDLAWLVDLVRANNGVVMTLSEAITYYRARSHMVIQDEDLVWVPGIETHIADVSDLPVADDDLDISPNPFNPQTNIAFDLDEPAPVRIAIHDLIGATVAVLQDGPMDAGRHVIAWTGRDTMGRKLPSGTYIVQLSTPEEFESELVTLIK